MQLLPLTALVALLGLVPTTFAQGTDTCTAPTPISGNGPFAFDTTAATNTAAGTTCGSMSRDLFWVWTAAATGSTTISLCAGTSGWDTVVAVYSGSTCPAGAFLACNDDSCGLISQVAFTATAGQQYVIRIGSFGSGAGGAGSFTFGAGGGGGGDCTMPSTGPDVIVGDVSDVGNYAVTGTLDALALGTTSCNVGDANLSWVASTNQHPVIGGNLYRYKVVGGAGRFEQIGMSWLKHGFAALSGSLCCACQGGGGSQLGVGCSDPYSSGLNGSQSGLGPRWQVNAATGNFTYPPANPAWSGSTARRIEVQLADLEASGMGTRYFGEAQYVTPDDALAGNKNNNASWREITVSGSATDYTFALLNPTQRQQSAIRAWAQIDNQVQLTNVQVPGDGLLVVGSRAYDLGAGQWRYEYAVYNMNSHRSGGTFSVPVPAGANVTNAGFHDVVYRNGDGPGNVNLSSADWTFALAGGFARWSTQTEAQNPSANALRWGTTYNFRFDCDVAPSSGLTSLGLWRSGAPAAMDALARVPGSTGGSTAVCFGDGTGTACPCGNIGAPGQGCLNSLGTSGALAAAGTPSVAADTLVLTGSGMPNASCLYFQGTTLIGGGAGSVFGDGLRCAGGTVTRFGTRTNVQGNSAYPTLGDPSISVRGNCLPGDVRIYQAWYRNAASFCTADTFNLTNAWQVVWQS
ncbi:MAG: hypothetical protein NTY35_10190 [Planctomycetota bacterium]|nr:hypothetical protein [Planctomycetota bacterium]